MFRNVFVILVSLICCLSVFNAEAANLWEVWGGGTFAKCKGHEMNASPACIGQSELDGCQAKKMYARNYTDEYALHMMVATKITERGAYFCPLQIEAKNRNEGNAWTEYARLNAGCVWLCRKGFTGESCEQTEEAVSSCDPIPLKRSDYSGLKRLASGPGTSIHILSRWEPKGACDAHKRQTHDVMLAITNWTESGHGAKVRMLVHRAQREGWSNMVSWSAVYPVTGAPEVLVCKNGYRPAGNDCVEINQALCADAQRCSGFGGTYDENIHKFVAKNGCFEFRCKENGKAFPTDTDRTCEPCNVDLRTGILSGNGVCHTCEKGKFFKDNVNAPCGEAIGLTKQDMQYGKGKTKASQRNLDDQCWVNTESDKYRQCVLNGGPVDDVPGGDEVEPDDASGSDVTSRDEE